jgi:hypothetical protein
VVIVNYLKKCVLLRWERLYFFDFVIVFSTDGSVTVASVDIATTEVSLVMSSAETTTFESVGDTTVQSEWAAAEGMLAKFSDAETASLIDDDEWIANLTSSDIEPIREMIMPSLSRFGRELQSG